jgi:Acyltransferase family
MPTWRFHLPGSLASWRFAVGRASSSRRLTPRCRDGHPDSRFMSIQRSSRMGKPNPPFYVGFDYLRALLALAVIAWHVKLFGASDLFQPGQHSQSSIRLSDILNFQVLVLAVPTFFLMSMVLFLERVRHRGAPYFRTRLRHLFLLYVFWVALWTGVTWPEQAHQFANLKSTLGPAGALRRSDSTASPHGDSMGSAVFLGLVLSAPVYPLWYVPPSHGAANEVPGRVSRGHRRLRSFGCPSPTVPNLQSTPLPQIRTRRIWCQ